MSTASTGVGDQDIRHLQLPAGTLRVLQVTDTHLYAKPGPRLLGIDTLDSFHTVIEAIEHCGWAADMVLATGDLVHDASPQGYRSLTTLLDRFGVPVYCLPGNHDNPEVMRQHLSSPLVSTPGVVDRGDWRIVLLDSVVVGEVGGYLASAQLNLLRDALRDNRRHTLVTLHHQPVRVGSDWIDDMGLDNGDEFLAITDQAPQVRGVLWGHVHQQYDAWRGDVSLMASPSTCVQFAPHSHGFAVDVNQPGFRLLALTPDGTIHSQVIRSEAMPAGLDLASAGYE